MSRHSVAIIGTGDPEGGASRDGFAMAYKHANAYRKLDTCELVGCADIVPENVEAFAQEYDIDSSGVFEDHQALLNTLDPDIVSIAVPPSVHADITIDCIRAGVPAIHCEKPMADTWDAARLMTQEAFRHECQLTFNHQRRFGRPFQLAKELLNEGAIGTLQRVEVAASNIYDYGSHSIDLCNYYNDEIPASWVLGGLDYRDENMWFGAHNENQAIGLWAYENGVHGLATTGIGAEAVNAHNRLLGTEGVIEIGNGFPGDDRIPLRMRQDGAWQTIDTDGEGLHGDVFFDRTMEHIIDCLEEDEPSLLRAEHALNATEIIFGIWESSRRRGRVEFPLDITGNPLADMVDSGELNPTSSE